MLRERWTGNQSRTAGADLVDADGRHLQDVGHAVHGGQGQPPLVLLLRQVQHGDDRRLLVVRGVPAQQLRNL